MSKVKNVEQPMEQPKRSGKFIFANSDIYEGEFEINAAGSLVRQGQGVFTCSDGVIYSGNWSNDKMNGKGYFLHPSGSKYKGNFVDGKFDGSGSYTWPDGSSYEGEFKDSKLEGKGFFKDPTGQIWTGKFQGSSATRLKFKLCM
jgi:hypothetical protein